MTAEEKRQLIASRNNWWHSIDVGDGIVTPGMCPPEYQAFMWKTLQMPEDMRGMRVLDVGTYDGFFAFECERRGADVVAIDALPETLTCFGLAKQMLGSRVRYERFSVYDLDERHPGGEFDLVLFLGVYYHLRHPLLALDKLWGVTKGELRVETHVIDDNFVLGDRHVVKLADVDARLVDVPIYRFYRYNDLNKVDYSNWFGGNIAAVLDSLGSAGFEPTLLGKWNARAAFRAVKNPKAPREWEIGSYEGTAFTQAPDGSWVSHYLDPRAHGMKDRGPIEE